MALLVAHSTLLETSCTGSDACSSKAKSIITDSLVICCVLGIEYYLKRVKYIIFSNAKCRQLKK